MSYHRVHTPIFPFLSKKNNSYEGRYIKFGGGQMMYPTHVTGSDFAYLTPHLPRYSTVAQLQWWCAVIFCHVSLQFYICDPRRVTQTKRIYCSTMADGGTSNSIDTHPKLLHKKEVFPALLFRFDARPRRTRTSSPCCYLRELGHLASHLALTSVELNTKYAQWFQHKTRIYPMLDILAK